jgi:hypothetical protein
MTDQVRTLSPAAQFILTHRIPCAALAVLMFSAVILGVGLSGIPMLTTLMLLVGLILHMLTPVLFALVMFGGGLVYALQVAVIAALVITLITDFSLMNGVVFLLLYAFLPVVAAATIGKPGGMGRSAQRLALSLFIASMAALLAAAGSQGVDIHTFVEQMLAPFFDTLASTVPADEQAALEALEQMRTMTVWAFPGFLAFSLWMVWWMDILLARRIAIRYGFFQGDHTEMLMIRFSKAAGIALIVAAALANLTGGSVQYMAVSIAIMLAGLLALQGVSIAHVWFKTRGMQLSLVIMYLLLLIWSVMILPFIIIGLLDIWFDFRRNMLPVNGEE